MADTKISGLPAASVPLGGTEVLPIVQGTTTKKVSVDNLTAGKAISALSVAATNLITQQGGYRVPYTLFQTAIPFVVVSSGTMGNNGALTGITAVGRIYPNAYVYLPANAISAGSAAGWYYAVFSSTTAATVYNNTFTSGTPTIPSSPTAFVTTGPGAYTQTTGVYFSAPSFTIPANTFGINSRFLASPVASNNTTATAKLLGYQIDSTFLTATGMATAATTLPQLGFASRGVNSAQIFNGGTTIILTNFDMTVSHTFSYLLSLSTATDTVTLESAINIMYP